MEPIRVLRGTGTAPTELAAYDAALTDAGVGEYNLVGLSSVIPAGAEVRTPDAVPDLGATGDRLFVVEAGERDDGPVGAALAWARGPDGRGIFYETAATGDGARDRARAEARAGVDAGIDLRDWSAVERETLTAGASPAGDAGTFAAAVVVAAYGEGASIL